MSPVGPAHQPSIIGSFCSAPDRYYPDRVGEEVDVLLQSKLQGLLLFVTDVQCASDGSISYQDEQALDRDESLDTMDYCKNYDDSLWKWRNLLLLVYGGGAQDKQPYVDRQVPHQRKRRRAQEILDQSLLKSVEQNVISRHSEPKGLHWNGLLVSGPHIRLAELLVERIIGKGYGCIVRAADGHTHSHPPSLTLLPHAKL